MGKQPIMTSGTQKETQCRRDPSKGRRLQSATPGPAAAQSDAPPRFMLTLKTRQDTRDADAALKSKQSFEVRHGFARFLEESPPGVTRTGRTVHEPKHLDAVEASLSSDMAKDQSSFAPDEDVYSIINALNSTTNTLVDLPCLSKADDSDSIQPYSAKLLTQLYIFCYLQKQWDICDLVADTWIRAFHDVRRKSERQAVDQVWRPNKALARRKRNAHEAWRRGQDIPAEFDPSPRDYGLIVSDPEMEPDVTGVNIALVNALYERTQPTCGARLLWADALALAGVQTEIAVEAAVKRGIRLHADLAFNMMQTGLRMVRRNLTLKIEESTEGAWCRRYHEHGKHGTMCYREKAWKHDNAIFDGGAGTTGSWLERNAEGNAVHGDDLDSMDAVLCADEAAQRDQKRGGCDGNADSASAKRVRFGSDQHAEADSEVA